MNDTEDSKELTIREQLVVQGVPSFITHPTSRDKKILAALGVMSIIGFALIPFRVWFINHPEMYSLIIGGMTSAVLLGSQYREDARSIYWVAASVVGAMKFFPLYLIIARCWGKDFLDYITAYVPKIHDFLFRLIDHAPHKLRLYSILLTPLSYIPFMRVSQSMTAVLMHCARMSTFTIVSVNVVCLLMVNYGFFYLGYLHGDAVLSVVEVINKYSGWITAALIFYAVYSAQKNTPHKKSVG